MLLSMTGFGRTVGEFNERKISIELRSLNSKNFDFSAKIHSYYKEIEAQIRTVIYQQIARGKVDLTINIESDRKTKSSIINKDLIYSYWTELKELNQQIGQESEAYDYLPLLLQMPDIYINKQEILSEEEQEFIIQMVHEACAKLIEFRIQDGAMLAEEFRERIAAIDQLASQILVYEPDRIKQIKERFSVRLKELSSAKYDENRLEQELIYYIERLDISEEKMRLSNHLNYFLETLQTKQAGKKLGFIIQEIGREINTMGSKSNHPEMQKLVVDMKDNLEKMKEQILNVL